MNPQEIEVKIYVTNLAIIEEKLLELGANRVQERIHERNMRYDTPDGSLTTKGIVLRLREDSGIKLTYKTRGTLERGISTREELEVEVSDFDTMEAILQKFGFEQHMFYEKYRTVYTYNGTYIMLDELPFGNFVEVEGDTEGEIEGVLAELGLQDIERQGDSYSKLFEHVKHHMGLTFHNLTFENFQDIDVPQSAFIAPGSIVIR
ncbi:MAG: class IV adenylate cyclase [Anaerolineae bacterium]|nr:class IV adenylate cyclase [Anaerolineae bacterium]MDQ7033680.1 class IV adenylate cyclase [Anaerolineae bacterium]